MTGFPARSSGYILHLLTMVYSCIYCGLVLLVNRHCLGYCYADLISKSLAEFVMLWNQHRIRKSAGARCPSGIPDVLYHVPETAGKQCEIVQVFFLLKK